MIYLINGRSVISSNKKSAIAVAGMQKTIKIDIGADLFDEYKTTLFNAKYFSERICDDISEKGYCKLINFDLDEKYLIINVNTKVEDKIIKKIVEDLFSYHTKVNNMSFFKNGETSFYGWVDRVPKIEIY
jgi:hypothetical protein